MVLKIAWVIHEFFEGEFFFLITLLDVTFWGVLLLVRNVCSVIKQQTIIQLFKREIMKFTDKWTELENNVLSEVPEIPKVNMVCGFYIYGIYMYIYIKYIWIMWILDVQSSMNRLQSI